MSDDEVESGTTGQPWTRDEIGVVVASYFDMLDRQIAGQSVNKAAEYRRIQIRLSARSLGSIEYKFMNVSGVLADMRLRWVAGLAPAFNYQRLLIPEVEPFAERRLGAMASEAESPPVESVTVPNVADDIFVGAPVEPPTTEARQLAMSSPVARKIDFAAIEARNRSLGRQGEVFVVGMEQRNLRTACRDDLASRVRHISLEDGDGAGFDVLSFEPQTGAERLIEVKTTRSGIWTPFILTRNELQVSQARSDHYRLYRVHEFGTRTRVYSLEGNLQTTCQLDPVAFRALPRSA